MQEQSGILIGESFVGAQGTPQVADVLAARHAPADPFFTLA